MSRCLSVESNLRIVKTSTYWEITIQVAKSV